MAYIKTLTDDKAIAVVHLGYRSNGKVVQKQKTFNRPTNVSVSRWRKSHHLTLINTWENGLKIGDVSQDNIKLDSFIDLWEKEHGSVHLRANTLASYKDTLRLHVMPSLGHMYLRDIKTIHVQKLVNDLTQKGLARRTIAYPKQVLSSILGQAVRWGYLAINPCERVEIPPIPKKEKRRYYEKEEVRQLVNFVKDEPLKYQAIFFLALSGGMRRSEILNLKGCDVTDKGVNITRGKNDSSVRFVSLDAATLVILRKHKAEQSSLAYDLGWPEGWLFTQADGTRMANQTPTKWLEKLCKRNGIEWVGFHALRHTSATLLISSGVDIKTVSSRIGHHQTSTTINIYAHMLKDKEEAAADLIGDIIHAKENPKPRELLKRPM